MTVAGRLNRWCLSLTGHAVMAPKPARADERPLSGKGSDGTPDNQSETSVPAGSASTGQAGPPRGGRRRLPPAGPAATGVNEFFETQWPRLERLTYDTVRQLAKGTRLSHDDVEDLVQEVRLAVLRLAQEGYRALPCEFGVLVRKGVAEWLRGTAAHKVTDVFRRQGRCELPISALEDGRTDREEAGLERLLGDGGLAARQMLEEAHRHKLEGDLRQALDGLSALQQEAMVLLVHRGASYQEMARHYGVPVGTMKSRVSEARRKLRRSLKARGWELDDE